MQSQTQTAPNLSSPARNAFPITPSDTLTLGFSTAANSLTPYTTRGLMVNGASGTVQVTMSGDEFAPGQIIVFNLNAGVEYGMQVRQVWGTNTTATSIVSLL